MMLADTSVFLHHRSNPMYFLRASPTWIFQCQIGSFWILICNHPFKNIILLNVLAYKIAHNTFDLAGHFVL